jgi:predicted metal-dependent hydrolase
MIHPHKIIYSSRRTLALEVKSSGQVIVRSPKKVGLDYIQKFVAGRQDWLSKVIEKMSVRKVVAKPWSEFSSAELQQVKKQAKALFEEITVPVMALEEVLSHAFYMCLWGIKGNNNNYYNLALLTSLGMRHNKLWVVST